jgi:hypothetical protein
MNILPLVQPTVNIQASQNPVCSNSAVTFTATASAAGSNVIYQWKKNGLNVGVNSNSFVLSNPANNDTVECFITSSAACTNGSIVGSNRVIIQVGNVLIPSVSINASQNNVCLGTSVTFTATPVNGGLSPQYQWKINGNPVGNNNPVFASNTLSNSDIVTVVMNSSVTCASQAAVTSNAISMIVNPVVTPAISVSVLPSTTICQGTNVVFTANATNGGSNPVFQWKKNGTHVGTNNLVYSNNSLSNGDIITLEMSVSGGCFTQSQVVSTPVSMTVNPLPASPVISANGINLSSNMTSGNQWFLNGNPIQGANGQNFTIQTSGWYTVRFTNSSNCSNVSDSVFVIMTSSSNMSLDQSVRVMPNPFVDVFYLNVDQAYGDLKGATYSITDLMGRQIVKSQRLDYTNRIDLTDQENGMYIIQVDQALSRSVIRVVKQK